MGPTARRWEGAPQTSVSTDGCGEPVNHSEPRQSRYRSAERGVALTIAILMDAVAFATVLRPQHAYTSTQRLLVVLAIGMAVAVGASIIAGAGAAAARRRRTSLWEATTTLSTLGIVLALFITAAIGSRIIPTGHPGAHRVAVSTPAERADFQRWQATVVPLAVRWMDAIRTDQAFIHGLPDTGLNELRRRVDRSQRTIDELSLSLAADAPRVPQPPALRRVTKELTAGLAVSERAQAIYALAMASAVQTGIGRNDRARRSRLLIDHGNTELTHSRTLMYAFSLDANKLGELLFAEKQ